MRTFLQYLVNESPDESKTIDNTIIGYRDIDARTFFIINHEYMIGSTEPTTHDDMIAKIRDYKTNEIRSNKNFDTVRLEMLERDPSGNRPSLSSSFIEGRIWIDSYVISFWNKEKDIRIDDIQLIFDLYNISESDRKEFRIDIEHGRFNFEDLPLVNDFKKQKTKQKSLERIKLEKELMDAQRMYHTQTGTVKKYTAALIKKIQNKILSLK